MVNDVATMASDVQSHSFLKGLSVQQLEALSKIATQAEFTAGKTIFRQRDAADRFYLIEKGRVGLDYGLPRKRHVQIQTIGPGEALGWSWLAKPYQWQFSATAIDDVTVSFFHVADLREQCARDPKLGYAIMERVAQSVNGTFAGDSTQTSGLRAAREWRRRDAASLLTSDRLLSFRFHQQGRAVRRRNG